MSKSFIRAVCSLIVIVIFCAALSVYAMAKELTLLDGALTVSDTRNNISESGGTLTAEAKGGYLSPKTNTITLTNGLSETAKLTFNYSASNYSSFSESKASGTYEVILEGGASVTMSIKGKKAISNNTATLTLSNFSLSVVSDSEDVTFSYNSSYGSITVDGVAVSDGGAVNIGSSGAALVATAKSGAAFLGWIDGSNKVLSTSASYTLVPSPGITVQAVFASTAYDAAPWFAIGAKAQGSFSYGVPVLMEKTGYYWKVTPSYLYSDLNAVAAAAEASAADKVVVLMNNGKLSSGDYTIPAGVTLLIPFDTANTLYTTDVEYVEMPNAGPATPQLYRKLTLADGANLKINGALSLSAKIYSGAGGKQAAGMSANYYSQVDLQGSSITVNNGGALYAYGYITGSGTVTASSGATVYESFVVEDFRGGTQTTAMKNGVLPFSQYYIQNIQVPLTVNYGANVHAYTSFAMSGYKMNTSLVFLGKDQGMFKMTGGTTTMYYKHDTDRFHIELEGSMSVAPVSINFGLASINTDSYRLPVHGGLTVEIKENSALTIDHELELLPGAEIKIAKGATVSIAQGRSVTIYDADEWGGYCGPGNKKLFPAFFVPGRTYTRTEADLVDCSIQVNGTWDSSLGYLYTTKGGANIWSTDDEPGTVITSTGSATVSYQLIQGDSGGYVEIPITATKLKNGDGSYLNSATDTYYYENGKWRCTNHTKVTDAAVAPTCTETGLTAGEHCSACGDVFTAQKVVAALGHTEVTDPAVAATCTETGLTEGKHCSACSTVLVAQEEVAALGHTWGEWSVTTAPTCTKTGLKTHSCTVCSESETETVAALGHTEVIDAAVAATCTETGLTEGKHCSVCNEVLVAQTVVEALGHDEVADAAADPTCTETGLTAGSHCDTCGEVFTAQEKIPALGHDEVVDPAVAATCTETGLTAGSHCETCGEAIIAQEEVAALGHDYESETVAPTCEEAGYTELTCKRCDHTYRTGFKAPGHTWAGNTCSVCGLTKETTLFSVAGTNVRAGDSLDIFFYVPIGDESTPGIQTGVEYVAAVTRTYDYRSQNDTPSFYDEIPFSEWTNDGGYYRFCYEGIAAKEMADNVYITILRVNDDGTKTVVSKVYTESIRGYATRSLSVNSGNAKLCTALVDMLNYGAACQQTFGYNTDDLANSKLSADQKAFATASVSIDKTKFNAYESTKLKYVSVSAKSNLVLTLVFENVEPGMTANITYVDHYGTEVPQSVSIDDNHCITKDGVVYYYVDVMGLAIADGRQLVNCKVVDSNGETVAETDYSVERYIANNSTSTDPVISDDPVYTMLMKFVDSAHSYFHPNKAA